MMGAMGGKAALVTGSGSGIGQAIALAFASQGARVVVADKIGETAESTAQKIKESGADAIAIQCDVTRERDVEALVHSAVEAFGRLDYAVNNAGIGSMNLAIVDYPLEAWNEMLNINLTGVFLCLKHEIGQMLKQGGGAIVNIASVGGLIGTPFMAAYTASKHGVVGLTKTAALEYAQSGVRVNAVCPGAVRTATAERLAASNPEMAENLIKAHPIGRMGEVEEVAAAVIWLCSDSASFVTGHAMIVDGGLVAQ